MEEVAEAAGTQPPTPVESFVRQGLAVITVLSGFRVCVSGSY